MQDYYSLLRHLRKSLPLGYPLSVRRCQMMDGVVGEAILQNKRYRIKIDKTLGEGEAIGILTHEYAHCLVLNVHDGHGVPWGKAYSKVYREYLKWVDKVNGD